MIMKCVLFLSLVLLGTVRAEGEPVADDKQDDILEEYDDQDQLGEDSMSPEESLEDTYDIDPESNEDDPEANDDVFTTGDDETTAVTEGTNDYKYCTCTKGGAPSCAEIKKFNPKAPSGFYKLIVNKKQVTVYCHMGTLCGNSNGWTRLAHLPSNCQRCPSTLKQYTTAGVRHCGRPITNSPGSCPGVKFSSNGINYSKICGKVTGFQYFSTDGARAFHHGNKNINKAYMDGVSITQGYPRKHVWSFISGLSETKRQDCPCGRGGPSPAKFVGNDYFCEAGFPDWWKPKFAIEDPLWDGKKCNGKEKACCVKSGNKKFLPYFLKTMTKSSKYLELRICCDENTKNENVSVLNYDLYVQ